MEGATRVKFEIKGIAPILFDRYHGLPDPKTPEGYKKQSIEKLYLDKDENICIPSCCLKAAIRVASSELGKKMEGKKNRQAIRSGVFFDDLMLPTGYTKPDGIREDLVTRGNGDKVTRVISYRPYLNEWIVSGEVSIFFIPVNFAKQAIELAGIKYGLCGYRPEYGRFMVTKFDIIEDNE